MTPADIDRAVEALRRAFPFISDEGVERFRRELAPMPVWSFADRWWSLSDDRDVYAEVHAYDEASWKWCAWPADGRVVSYAPARSDAMRAAERALGLPECEVVT